MIKPNFMETNYKLENKFREFYPHPLGKLGAQPAKCSEMLRHLHIWLGSDEFTIASIALCPFYSSSCHGSDLMLNPLISASKFTLSSPEPPKNVTINDNIFLNFLKSFTKDTILIYTSLQSLFNVLSIKLIAKTLS